MAEILVVEDYPQLASIIARNLRRRGHVVAVASTVAEALSYAHHAFDYAVLDIDLPDGNGVNLAENLVARGCAIDIVFFTATWEASTLARAAKLGKVIGKVAGFESLLRTIEEWQARDLNSVDGAPISRVVDSSAPVGRTWAAAVPNQSMERA